MAVRPYPPPQPSLTEGGGGKGRAWPCPYLLFCAILLNLFIYCNPEVPVPWFIRNGRPASVAQGCPHPAGWVPACGPGANILTLRGGYV